ncbi:hypothetical protein [Flavimobilis soli]|uniref:hypothetical protein n=1 Tax=Flavimobilis soli TaxID=442709 RepID=UPI000BF8366D|nr:hypothetical protein [Flavimobilis soli]
MALSATLGPHACFSHTTAALLWDLPTWGTSSRIHVTSRSRSSVRRGAPVARHVALVPDDERTEIRGLPATTLARTVADCAMTSSPAEGLVIADAALRSGADPAEVAALLTRRSGRRGVRLAREILACADVGAESPGESLTRLILLAAGFPRPTTQLEVRTHLGTFRADMGWEEWRLLIEYDGRSKYAGAELETFMREKRRADALVEAGWRLLRVTKEDLRDPDVLVTRVRRMVRGPIPHTSRPALRLP